MAVEMGSSCIGLGPFGGLSSLSQHSAYQQVKERDLKFVKEYQPHDKEVQLRFMLYGPSGAGKSRFINSVESALRGEISDRAGVDAISHGSFTTKFNPLSTLSEDNQHFNSDPSLNDRVHVLVCIISANTAQFLTDDLVKKLREVRLAARDMEVGNDIRNVYKSKYLKKKIEELNAVLGFPQNRIFPVKNHSEIDTKDDTDTLILSALRRMIKSGEDFVNDL
ncbi:hypothetical protein NQZ68_028349 [Dissostichus eleginoides]|nr:hypothetical protein NQZ68_028349 [Dissostichus eleginoides]